MYNLVLKVLKHKKYSIVLYNLKILYINFCWTSINVNQSWNLSNLPAKSQQEAQKHRQEYEKMVEIAKKKGNSTKKSKYIHLQNNILTNKSQQNSKRKKWRWKTINNKSEKRISWPTRCESGTPRFYPIGKNSKF